MPPKALQSEQRWAKPYTRSTHQCCIPILLCKRSTLSQRCLSSIVRLHHRRMYFVQKPYTQCRELATSRAQMSAALWGSQLVLLLAPCSALDLVLCWALTCSAQSLALTKESWTARASEQTLDVLTEHLKRTHTHMNHVHNRTTMSLAKYFKTNVRLQNRVGKSISVTKHNHTLTSWNVCIPGRCRCFRRCARRPRTRRSRRRATRRRARHCAR